MSADPPETDHLLDVIVRFHDPERIEELGRCVFSLVGQTYRPLHLHIVLQRFAEAQEAMVATALAPFFAVSDPPSLTVHNYRAAEPADARSALINMGLAAARGRYGAFLDFDDALYPEAYELLVDRLRKSGARIAFGGIVVKRVRAYPHAPYVLAKERPFAGRTVLDLFRDNFCPIHSFVFDRRRIPAEDLRFEEALVRAEDYDFLLRVCSGGPSDFGAMDRVIGDYYWRTDASNTVLVEGAARADDARRRPWTASAEFLERRRCETIVAPEVQLAAGLARPEPGLTIRGLLERLEGA